MTRRTIGFIDAEATARQGTRSPTWCESCAPDGHNDLGGLSTSGANAQAFTATSARKLRERSGMLGVSK